MRHHAKQGHRIDVRDALALLRRIDGGRAGMEDLLRATGRSEATVKRLLSDLQLLGVRIDYVPGPVHPRQDGHYQVADWGLLRRERVLSREI